MRSKVDRRGFFRAMMGAALGTLGAKTGRARPKLPTPVDWSGVTMGAVPVPSGIPDCIKRYKTVPWTDAASATPVADILALRDQMRAYSLDLSITMAPSVVEFGCH